MASRRQQILDTAAELFAERGFHGVTVDDLGAALGMSGPALYHHFTSKESILDEMLVNISRFLLAEGRLRTGAAASPDNAVRELLRGQIDFALDQTTLITVHHRELIHASVDGRQQIRRLQAEYTSVWVDVLIQLDPSLDRRRGLAATHAVLGLINSTRFSRHVDRATMSSMLFDMSYAALAATFAGDLPVASPLS